MPTLIHEEDIAMQSATEEVTNRPKAIDFGSLELERFISECPSSFGLDEFAPAYLWKNVINENHELLFFTLDELKTLYFNDSKLSTLSKLCHNKEDNNSVTILNCSFYVTIGMKEAYETEFAKSKSIKTSSEARSICFKTKGLSTSRGSKRNYEEIFVDFFHQMFAQSEADKLEITYQKKDVLTICIFARESYATKTNLTKFSDQLVGVSSFVVDNLDTVLLSWLGVVEKTMAELNVHVSHKDDNTSLRKNFNIGTFLLILCQVFKSTLQKKWCPIVCQVHGEEKEGPLNFYRKNFFFKTTEMNQIVYSQLVHRKDSIIYDDDQLVWMVLLYPLNDLLMSVIDRKTDWNSYYLILIRGYYYFLNRNRDSLRQEEIEICIKNYCKNNSDFFTEGVRLQITKDIIDDTESYEKYFDDSEMVKPKILSAGNQVLQTFLDVVNNRNQSQLSLLDCGNGVDTTDNNSIFLAISKIIYGSSHYYINLRLFLCFYYRSVSMLSRNHPFYKNEDIDMMICEILERIFHDKIPDNIYLPDSDNTVDPARYRRIIYRLYQHLMYNDAAVEYHDLYILSSMFGVELIVIEGRSGQFVVPENVQDREWQINFNRSFSGNQFINQCLVKFENRPKIWLACMFESQFMAIIENVNEAQFDDITYMIPTVGLQQNKNDESDLLVLSQGIAIPESDIFKELYPFLIKEPFKIVKNLQKMFNIYRHSTTIKKYKKKGKHGIPGFLDKEYGQVMECSEFVNAGVPDEYVLGCLRCLDPPQALVENKIWPISNQCQFEDLMHLRTDTWLNETCTKLFIDYLSSQSDKYFFLDPATFNNSVTQSETMMQLITMNKYEDHPEKDIIILFHIKDHFIIVEIRRSMVWEHNKSIETINDTEPDLKKTPVYLACSLGQELSSLVKQVEERHLELFLNILFDRGGYEYKTAEYVQRQNYSTANECGVLCLQRMYKYAFFDNVHVDLPENLRLPKAFRCFILYKILEFRRRDVSPYVLYNEEKLASIGNLHDADSPGISTNLLRVVDHEIEFNNYEINNTGIVNTSNIAILDNAVEKTESPDGTATVNQVKLATSTEESSHQADNATVNITELLPVDHEITTGESTFLPPATTTIIVPNYQIEEISPSYQATYQAPSPPPTVRPMSPPSSRPYQAPSSPPTLTSMKRKVASITQGDDDQNNDNDQKSSSTVTDQGDDDLNDKDDPNDDQKTSSTVTEYNNDNDFMEEEERKKKGSGKETVNRVAKKPKSKFTIRIPTSNASPVKEPLEKRSRTPTRQALKSRTPTRVSDRIKSRTLTSPPITIPRKLSASNKIRNPREPKNYAIGFAVTKKPISLTPAMKKHLNRVQVKKEVIDARKALFDKWEECNFAEDSSDEENIVDLFEDNDPWYFLDKQLLDKELPESLTLEEKHKPEIFLPLLYEPFQHNSRKAEEVVKAVILPKYEKAKRSLTEATDKLNRLLKRFGDRKNNKIVQAREEYEKAAIVEEMLKWEMTGQKMFLPYDSIYAIQALPSEYIKGEFDYYAITDNPDGRGFAKKMVSKTWLDENVDSEYMCKVNAWKGSNGWITFSDTLNEFKVLPEDANFDEALLEYNLDPVYQYKPLRGDDEILIVRCQVFYDQYDNFTKIKKICWSVLTLKESFSLTPRKVRDLPKDPMEEDEDGERLHKSIYSNISKELLCSIIGCEFVFLLETASVLCGEHERKRPFNLSPAPKFNFADDFDSTNRLEPSSRTIKKSSSSVTLESENKRMYDVKDMLPKNQRHCMPLDFIGDFSHPQYYYYDMRGYNKRYYVHCVTTQISGMYYDELKNKFFGLCKRQRTNEDSFVHHIELEDDWVEDNFKEEFLDLVKNKSKKDHRKFIKLPIGKAKPLSSPLCNHGNPIINYLQNGKDNCVFASMASVLSYMGYTALADLVMKYETEFVKTQFTNDTYGAVLGLVNHKIQSFKCKNFNQKYQLRRIRNHEEFDLIENATNNPNIMYHVVLSGADGSENHCVCIYHNFIFDGNYTHAWRLQQSSLDECIDTTFIGINDGYMHIPNT
jgi:hypothetical protein